MLHALHHPNVVLVLYSGNFKTSLCSYADLGQKQDQSIQKSDGWVMNPGLRAEACSAKARKLRVEFECNHDEAAFILLTSLI